MLLGVSNGCLVDEKEGKKTEERGECAGVNAAE